MSWVFFDLDIYSIDWPRLGIRLRSSLEVATGIATQRDGVAGGSVSIPDQGMLSGLSPPRDRSWVIAPHRSRAQEGFLGRAGGNGDARSSTRRRHEGALASLARVG